MIDVKDILQNCERINDPQKKMKKRYFVPFFRVASGHDFFAPKEHQISDLPAEIYERFHSKI